VDRYGDIWRHERGTVIKSLTTASEVHFDDAIDGIFDGTMAIVMEVVMVGGGGEADGESAG
jgi:hypothetical protein